MTVLSGFFVCLSNCFLKRLIKGFQRKYSLFGSLSDESFYYSTLTLTAVGFNYYLQMHLIKTKVFGFAIEKLLQSFMDVFSIQSRAENLEGFPKEWFTSVGM